MNRQFLALCGLMAVIIGALGASTYIILSRPSGPAVAARWLHLSSAFDRLPVPGNSDQQTALLVLDVDRDGLNDFVVGSRHVAPSLVWYRRQPGGWHRYVIESDLFSLEAGGAFHDIDRDGDLDLVMGEDSTGNAIYWWQNPYPEYDRRVDWPRFVVKAAGAAKHHDQVFGDFDSDGEAELVFWNQGAKTLYLAKIPQSLKPNEPWPLVPILTTDSDRYEGLAVADLDGDGRSDLVGGGHWLQYLGNGTYAPRVIDEAMTFTRTAVGQLVEGGWQEVVFVVGDDVGPLRWYERKGTEWIAHSLLSDEVQHGHSLDIADVDGDGHMDIFCAEMHTPGAGDDAKLWVFRGNGKGAFEATVVSTGLGNHESRIADLDGDGDLDVLVKPYHWNAPRIDILLNRISPWDEWRRHVIDAERPWRSVFVFTADLDLDGHTDIITGAWWYKNPGPTNAAWKRMVIGEPLNNVAAIHDFDGDGDADILGTKGEGSQSNAEFVWARNDGTGRFGLLDNIQPGLGDFLQGVAVDRFQDGKLSAALSWHASDTRVQMLTIPTEPETQTWSIETIAAGSQNEALSAGDIDNDGRLDLLLGTIWLRREKDGWSPKFIGPESLPDRNRLADINGDGRLDAVVGFEAISEFGQVVWYEQPKDHGTAWQKHHIAEVVGPMSLDVGDIDRDGDLDVVVGEHDPELPDHAKLHIFENLDGAGLKWIGHLVSRGDEHHDGAILVDIDNDRDLDIVSIGWNHGRVLLYENLMEN